MRTSEYCKGRRRVTSIRKSFVFGGAGLLELYVLRVVKCSVDLFSALLGLFGTSIRDVA